jgi:phage N-6-adenine-methyltransferase
MKGYSWLPTKKAGSIVPGTFGLLTAMSCKRNIKAKGGDMNHSKGLVRLLQYSIKTDDWQTPQELYSKLDSEFHFDDDPCPYKSSLRDGLNRLWGRSVFCNPPYSNIGPWVEKAYNHSLNKNIVVMLLPANRTDRCWWHKYCMKASEFRFIRGRLKFTNSCFTQSTSKASSIANVIVIFGLHGQKISSIDNKGFLLNDI